MKNDDERSKLYTGLSWEVFLKLFLSLTVNISAKFVIPVTEQLCLTLAKVRFNIPFEITSRRAGMDIMIGCI